VKTSDNMVAKAYTRLTDCCASTGVSRGALPHSKLLRLVLACKHTRPETTWSKNVDAPYACNRRVNAMVAVPTQRSAKRPASIKSRVDTGSGTSTSAGAGSDTGVGCVSYRARKQNENERDKRQQKSATAGINQAQHPQCRARTECIWAGGRRKRCRVDIPQSSVPARQGLSTRRRTCTSSISAQDAVPAGEQSRDQDIFSFHVAQREQSLFSRVRDESCASCKLPGKDWCQAVFMGVVLAYESKGKSDDAGWGIFSTTNIVAAFAKIKCQNMRLIWHGFLGTVCIYIHSTGCSRVFN
jgi:hypothetical protein